MIPILKMQAQGNDFVIMDLFKYPFSYQHFSELTEEICRPHFGVGADGLVLMSPTSEADAKMVIYNSDGSRAEMCGSALRCVAWLMYLKTKKTHLNIITDSGVKTAEIDEYNVSVNLGMPVFEAENMEVHGFKGSLVNIGNPHCVIWQDDLSDDPHLKYGFDIEHHPDFSKTVNVQFAKVLSKQRIELKIWENAVGATLACGTGATAAVFTGIHQGFLANKVKVKMPGGDVISQKKPEGYILSGEVEIVLEGTFRWNI